MTSHWWLALLQTTDGWSCQSGGIVAIVATVSIWSFACLFPDLLTFPGSVRWKCLPCKNLCKFVVSPPCQKSWSSAIKQSPPQYCKLTKLNQQIDHFYFQTCDNCQSCLSSFYQRKCSVILIRLLLPCVNPISCFYFDPFTNASSQSNAHHWVP